MKFNVSLERLTDLGVNLQVSNERRLDEPGADQGDTNSLRVASIPETVHQAKLPCFRYGVEDCSGTGSEEGCHRAGDYERFERLVGGGGGRLGEVVKSKEGGVDGSGKVDVEGSEIGRGD